LPSAVPLTVASTDRPLAVSVTVALSPANVQVLASVRTRVNPLPLVATIGTPSTLAPDFPLIVATAHSPTGHWPPAAGRLEEEVCSVLVPVGSPDGGPAAAPLLSSHALNRDNSPITAMAGIVRRMETSWTSRHDGRKA
jgi:hypothetical protein